MLLAPACTQGMQIICWHRICQRKALEALTKLKHCEMSITKVDYSVECHFDCCVQSLLVQLGKTPLSFPPVVQAAQLQQECFLFNDALEFNPVVSPHTQSLVLLRPGWQLNFLKHALSLRIQTSCRPQQCCLESEVSGSRQIEVCCSEAMLWRTVCAATPRLPRLHSSNCTCKEHCKRTALRRRLRQTRGNKQRASTFFSLVSDLALCRFFSQRGVDLPIPSP